jgi:hypothetical protein
VALGIFAAHRALIFAVQIDFWPQIGLAILETLAGYALLLWFGRRQAVDQFKSIRALFSA